MRLWWRTDCHETHQVKDGRLRAYGRSVGAGRPLWVESLLRNRQITLFLWETEKKKSTAVQNSHQRGPERERTYNFTYNLVADQANVLASWRWCWPNLHLRRSGWVTMVFSPRGSHWAGSLLGATGRRNGVLARPGHCRSPNYIPKEGKTKWRSSMAPKKRVVKILTTLAYSSYLFICKFIRFLSVHSKTLLKLKSTVSKKIHTYTLCVCACV